MRYEEPEFSSESSFIFVKEFCYTFNYVDEEGNSRNEQVCVLARTDEEARKKAGDIFVHRRYR